MKKCPYCAEEILNDAIKCKHCGEWLNKKTETQKVSEWVDNTKKTGQYEFPNGEIPALFKFRWLIALGSGFVVMVLLVLFGVGGQGAGTMTAFFILIVVMSIKNRFKNFKRS